jgi:hypothetical protein
VESQGALDAASKGVALYAERMALAVRALLDPAIPAEVVDEITRSAIDSTAALVRARVVRKCAADLKVGRLSPRSTAAGCAPDGLLPRSGLLRKP